MSAEVTLQSFDGSISITGELLDFKDNTYLIQSAVGRFEINALEMRCVGEGCPAAGSAAEAVRIAGAQAVTGKLMADLIEGYAFFRLDARAEAAAAGTGTQVTVAAEGAGTLAEMSVTPLGSVAGFAALGAGEADLVVSSRAPAAGEAPAARDEKVLALDGLVILSHRNNPVRALAETDVPAIFAGQIAKWSELGGFDAAINIYVPAAETGAFEMFRTVIMDPARAALAPNVTVLESAQAVADAVAADPFGIGVGSFSSRREANAMTIRGACGVQTPANEFTIRTEDYPLTQRIYLYRGEKELSGHAASLVEFALSDEGQFLVSDAGFVDQRVSAEPVDNQGIRLASAMMDNGTDVSFGDLRTMMGDLVVGDRLSLTFRFEFGSSTLDSRARGDIQRLADLLSTGDYANKDVLLVGFTDAVGEPGKNRALSQARAAVVRDALVAAAPAGSLDAIRIRTAGFGEVAPLVCNDTDPGRAINRRVEVWVSDLVRQVN
jgi:phosphate transport system substrate-binding protein